MQIWNMKMKMGVIKVIYEAPQSHLWRRHDSLVSFMYGRPSLPWRASLPGAAVSLQGRAKVTYRVRESATVAAAFVRPLIYTFNKNVWPVGVLAISLRVSFPGMSTYDMCNCMCVSMSGIHPLKDATVFHCGANNKIILHVHTLWPHIYEVICAEVFVCFYLKT